MIRPYPTCSKVHGVTVLSLAVLCLAPTAALAEATVVASSALGPVAVPNPPRPRVRTMPRQQPATTPEAGELSDGEAGVSPFGKMAPASATPVGQTLTAPVTLNATTSANALNIAQTGAGSALAGTVNRPSSTTSAVKGLSNGHGAGIYGNNSGTGGPAGRFEINNAASAQPALLVTTTGTGNAVQATIKSGQGTALRGEGGDTGLIALGSENGVSGQGGAIGVSGISTAPGGNGIQGYSWSGTAVYGVAESLDNWSFGVWGYSEHYAGVFGQSSQAIGVQGSSDSNIGVYGVSPRGLGVRGESTSGEAIYGFASHGIGVHGKSDTGPAIYGESSGGYAGSFKGAVIVQGGVYAQGFTYTSDREAKQGFSAIDSGDVAARIAALPITTWTYKDKPAERHIGPMAQDFHAAFGLGADDRHIDAVDGIGVSLAAIKSLQQQVEQKTARIEALEAQVKALQQSVEARLAALETSPTAMASPAIAATALP